MEVQDPVAVLLYRAQCEAQDAIHKIERMPIDMIRPVGWIRIEQLVVDHPRVHVTVIVDDQCEAGHVGDVDERVMAFVADPIVAYVDREGDEEGGVLELLLRELVLAQNLVRPQRERQQLRTADLPVAELAGVEDP